MDLRAVMVPVDRCQRIHTAFLSQRGGPARTHIAVGKAGFLGAKKNAGCKLRIGSVGQTVMTEQSNYRNSHLGKVALVLLAVALVAILGVYESIPVKQHNAAVASAAPDPTAQAIRDLQTSQQQAIDQLKGLQQTVSSGQAEVRRLSEEVTGLTHKLEALQQSFASAQRAPIVEPAEPAKQTQTPDNTEPPLSPSYGAGRVAGAAPFHGLSGATRSRPPGSPAATRRRVPKVRPPYLSTAPPLG